MIIIIIIIAISLSSTVSKGEGVCASAGVYVRVCVRVRVPVRHGAAVDEAAIIYAKLWPDLAKGSLIFVGLFHNAHYPCIFYDTSCICMCVCVRACVSVACVLLLI